MEESRMSRARCPECDAEITISDPQLGASLTCPSCSVKLEIYGTDPLDVYFPFDEVWDDDDWDADQDEQD
jgi:lysine biosynthesis protein LysW